MSHFLIERKKNDLIIKWGGGGRGGGENSLLSQHFCMGLWVIVTLQFITVAISLDFIIIMPLSPGSAYGTKYCYKLNILLICMKFGHQKDL